MKFFDASQAKNKLAAAKVKWRVSCKLILNDMQVVHLRDITEDYANTLAAWRERFFEKLDVVKEQGFDENFIRMWDFYLSYCEGGFRERVISTVQLSFAKPGYRFV